MAKYLPLPKSLQEADRNFIGELIKATESRFAGNLFGETNAPLTDSYTTTDGRYHWDSGRELLTYVTNLTNTDDIKSANGALYKTLSKVPEYSEPTMAEAPKQIDSNIPDAGIRAQNADTLAQREAAIKQADINAENKVQSDISRMQEIARQHQEIKEKIERANQAKEKLKEEGGKIYYRSKRPETENISPAEQSAIETLRQAVDQGMVQELADEIKLRVGKDIPDDLVEAVTTQTALDIAQNLNNESLAESAVILGKIYTNQTGLPSEIFDPIQESVAETFGPETLEYVFTREEAQSAFSEKFSEEVFGPKNLDDLEMDFSQTPKEGYREYDLAQIPEKHIEILNRRDAVVDTVQNFGEDQIRSQFLNQFGSWIEGRVATLPETGLISQVNARATLSLFGVGNPIAWEGTTMFGRLAIEAGYGPVLGWAGQITGINFGVGEAAAAVAAETAGQTVVTTAAASVGTTVTVGGGTAAVSSVTTGLTTAAVTGTTTTVTTVAAAEAGAAAGSVVPIVGTIIGAVGGFLVGIGLGKVAEKIPWDKVKEAAPYAAAVMIGVPAGIIGGPIIGVVAGVGVLGVMGGVSLAAIAGGIGNFFGALTAVVLGAVGMPILISLISLPIITALILFVINSGAYIVPPGQSLLNSTNPYIDVSKVADPTGPLSSPQTITYTITITAKKDELTGINFTNDCKAIGKSGANINCKDLEQIPDAPESISPGTPFTFSFTSNYDGKYKDSLVSDTFTVSAFSGEGGKVTEMGSASICFGDCPLNCFDLTDPSWKDNPNLQSMLTTAASTLSTEYPNFAAKVCPANGPKVKLCYTTTNPTPINPTTGSCVGATFGKDVEIKNGCTININKCVASYGDTGVLYLLTHEVTHHIQQINGHFQQLFAQSIPASEMAICTYGGTNAAESMAEGDALFVANPVIYSNPCGVSKSNYASKYPFHYKFAKNVMFGP